MVNLNEELKLLDGEPLTKGEAKKPITLKIALVDALGAMFEDERSLDGEEKLKRFKLSLKVFNHAEVELNSGETELLKKVVGKMYAPAVSGMIWLKLDPNL